MRSDASAIVSDGVAVMTGLLITSATGGTPGTSTMRRGYLGPERIGGRTRLAGRMAPTTASSEIAIRALASGDSCVLVAGAPDSPIRSRLLSARVLRAGWDCRATTKQQTSSDHQRQRRDATADHPRR